MSEFVLKSTEAAANEVIREHQIIKFTIEDSQAFVNALLNPPEPDNKLRAAFENYKKDVSSQPIFDLCQNFAPPLNSPAEF